MLVENIAPIAVIELRAICTTHDATFIEKILIFMFVHLSYIVVYLSSQFKEAISMISWRATVCQCYGISTL
jgi:hypothetical protein